MTLIKIFVSAVIYDLDLNPFWSDFDLKLRNSRIKSQNNISLHCCLTFLSQLLIDLSLFHYYLPTSITTTFCDKSFYVPEGICTESSEDDDDDCEFNEDAADVVRANHGCINIPLDTVLATDVNKYSLASARCQPIWRSKLANWIYF